MLIYKHHLEPNPLKQWGNFRRLSFVLAWSMDIARKLQTIDEHAMCLMASRSMLFKNYIGISSAREEKDNYC